LDHPVGRDGPPLSVPLCVRKDGRPAKKKKKEVAGCVIHHLSSVKNRMESRRVRSSIKTEENGSHELSLCVCWIKRGGGQFLIVIHQLINESFTIISLKSALAHTERF
jgi:hypothetical protein